MRASPPSATSSLDIADNQFVTLLGPSGCGKTTTLRLIAGFMAPDAGTIHADGRLVSSREQVVPPEERGMGMVFQNYAVWPHKTVFENVVFGLKLRGVAAGEARARVKATLALVNLDGLRGPAAERAVGRPAAARGAGAQPRGRAQDPAAGRAPEQPRCQAARTHAQRAEAAAAPHRHHLRLCHARSGRGAGACPTGLPSCMAAVCSSSARRRRSTPARPAAWSRISWAW